MRKGSAVTSRYAQAIYDYLKDAKKAREVADQLEAFGKLTEKVKDLHTVVWSALFSAAERRPIIEDVSKQLGFLTETVRVLLVLSEEGRLIWVEQIAEKLRLIMLEASKVVPLQVESPTTLSSRNQKSVEEKFKKVLGKEVEANFVEAPQLVGGLRVTAIGRTYDGSITSRLSTLKEQLAGG